MVNIELEEKITAEEMSELLSKVPFKNFFNSSLWIDILESSFRGFSGRWITARRGDVLVGFMPVIFIKRSFFYYLRSLPFGTYGTPVAENNDISLLLVKYLLKLSTSRRCLDLSAAILDSDWEKWFPQVGSYKIGECRIAELEGDFKEYRMGKLNSSKRKACNKCEREGVIVRPLKTKEEVVIFYNI